MMTPKERQLARLVTLGDLDLQAADRAMPATRGDIANLHETMKQILLVLKIQARITNDRPAA